MQSQVRTWAIAAGAAILVATTASAQFSDSFETSSGHPVGTGQPFTPGGVGTNGWKQWAAAGISDSLLHSGATPGGPAAAQHGSQYFSTQLASDTVNDFGALFTSGWWDVSVWTYVPGGASSQPMLDEQWFILMNAYSDAGPFVWLTQGHLDPNLGQISFDNGISLVTCTPQFGSGTTLTFDAWKEVRCEVDVTNDRAQVFYDGAPIGDAFVASQGPFGNNGGAGQPCPAPTFGTPAIDTIDLYANLTLATPSFCYWDNLNITAHSTCLTNVTSYCPLTGVSTNGCTATMAASSATASIAAGPGSFLLNTTATEGAKSGLTFYGVMGPVSVSWNSYSMLCVKAPTQRTPAGSSGGTDLSCNGSYSLDLFGFLAATPGALGNVLGVPVSGTAYNAQTWHRDPGNAKTTGMSNALSFTLCP